jgi:hypothetical protein
MCQPRAPVPGAPVDVAAAQGPHDAQQAVLRARQAPERAGAAPDLRVEPARAARQRAPREQGSAGAAGRGGQPRAADGGARQRCSSTRCSRRGSGAAAPAEHSPMPRVRPHGLMLHASCAASSVRLRHSTRSCTAGRRERGELPAALRHALRASQASTRLQFARPRLRTRATCGSARPAARLLPGRARPQQLAPRRLRRTRPWLPGSAGPCF